MKVFDQAEIFPVDGLVHLKGASSEVSAFWLAKFGSGSQTESNGKTGFCRKSTSADAKSATAVL